MAPRWGSLDSYKPPDVGKMMDMITNLIQARFGKTPKVRIETIRLI